VSIVLSIAEKLDNLYGSFSVGNIPKGSADPYALRRQSAAIVDLLISKKLHVPLDVIASQIEGKYKDGAKHTPAILDFIQVRAKTFFSDSGFKYDEVDAVLSTGMYDFYELFARASSLHEFRADEKFGSMLLSFKRMNNILSAFFQKNKGYALKFDAALLSQDEEKKLAAFFDGKRSAIADHLKANRYKELFAILIEAKPSIDLFFDKIMVMADDIKVRDNRLALLDSIISPFTAILDFSKIAD
jgi:glycyl-tRNA synthetase beta chain